MKKLFIAAITALGLTGFANAEKTTFKWETPGTVMIITDQLSNDPVTLAADQTEFEYEYSDYGYVWLYSIDGYAITSAVKEGDSKSISSSKSQKTGYSSQIAPFIGSAYDGKTVTVTLEKVVNDKVFTVNVENGAKYINTTLYATWKDAQNVSHGYTTTYPLSDGQNSVPFNTLYSSYFEFNLINGGNADNVYSATLNGEAISGGLNYYYGPYSPVETDVFNIRVFETEEVEAKICTLAFEIPDAIPDCIKNIRDWRKNDFVTLTDNKLDVIENSDIQVNFNDDITITKLMLGDQDITESYNADNKNVRFTVTASTTFAIEGYETIYGDVEFTAYVMNPEGVYITKEVYGGIRNNVFDSAEGDGVAITSDIQLPQSVINAKDGSVLKIQGSLMTPENTQVFKIKVSERDPYFYVSAANGYFIKAMWNSELTDPLPYASVDGGTTVYIVAQKLDYSAEAKVVVNGTGDVIFQASRAFSMMWDNRANTYGLMQGEQIVNFDAEYDNPFTIRPGEETTKFEAFLDGWKLGADDNGLYTVNFNVANSAVVAGDSTRAEESTSDAALSTLIIYSDYSTSAATGSVLVNTYDGMEASCYYSDLNIKAPANTFTLLAGTPVSIEPKGTNFRMSIDNDVIYGYQNGELVNKLTDGKYSFEVTKGMMAVFVIEEDLDVPSGLGVVEIEAAGTSDSRIFNIHGIYMGNDPENLPAGVYICNGKKLIKR